MKTGIITVIVAALVCNTGFAADRKSKAERTGEGPGVGIGAVVGTVLGGPVGFVAGVGLGGWISGRLHNDRKARDEYQARYEEADALAKSLTALLATSENDAQKLRIVMREQQDTYRDALQQALDVDVFFRTGEATLDDQVAERIARIGDLMREFDGFAIVVEGHADSRGEESYNEQLSAQRATAVRDALIRSGLPSDRITTVADGERGSTAAAGDLDGMALERRVDLSIVYPLPRENRVAQQ